MKPIASFVWRSWGKSRLFFSFCFTTLSVSSHASLEGCGNAPDKHAHSCEALHLVFSQVDLFQLINCLTTVGYLLEVFFRLWIPSLVRIPLLLGASTGNFSQSLFDTFSVGSWPIISELYSLNAPPDQNCLHICLYKGRGVVLHPFELIYPSLGGISVATPMCNPRKG